MYIEQCFMYEISMNVIFGRALFVAGDLGQLQTEAVSFFFRLVRSLGPLGPRSWQSWAHWT